MLILCKNCNQHHLSQDEQCPHCVPIKTQGARISSLLLLGIGLAACGEKASDTADTASSDTASVPLEPADAPEYGVEAVENEDEEIFLDYETPPATTTRVSKDQPK